jgi:uncharacterized peroxidase-related enzyme
MPRIAPLKLDDLPDDMRASLAEGEKKMGFRANDGLTMARVPKMLRALGQLAWSIYGVDGRVPLELRKLVAYITSTSAGCVYCQAHTAHGAFNAGVAPEKIAAAWDYETSPLFSAAERAALRVAQGAGHAPVEVTDADMAALKKHFDDDQIAEIVGVIALFGFLNKWNAVIGTEIESAPAAFVREHLNADG